jgi:hypothetical protein
LCGITFATGGHVGKLRKEITNSPSFMSLRQGGDNISRKARIVTSSIEDRKIRTVVDDPSPVLRFRFDGEGWSRWSVAWRAYEPAEVAPPLREHLAAEGVTPQAGDRYVLDAGVWRRLDADEPDEPTTPPA